MKNLDFFPYRYNQQIIENLRAVAKDLFDIYGFKSFAYLKIVDSCKLFEITTDLNWFEHKFFHLDAKTDSSVFQRQSLIAQEKMRHRFVWPTYPEEDAIIKGLYNYNTWHGINFYINAEDGLDIFSFGFEKGKAIDSDSFYINNVEYLQFFVESFRDRASSFLDYSQAFNVEFPVVDRREIECALAQEMKELVPDFLKNNNYFPRLSPMQHQCIQGLIQGKSAKIIAREFEISPRTVESYIGDLKIKFDCNNTQKILLKYMMHMVATKNFNCLSKLVNDSNDPSHL
jgi:DNA-binding CsgD family transcriptional regulator